MSARQKRPEEENFEDDENVEGEEEDQENNSDNDEEGGKKGDRKFECKCGKFYPLQSSLFNHIRIKHDDRKEEYAIPRHVRPGRPKNVEGKDKTALKANKRKEKKPEGLEDGIWALVKLYQNMLFQNLIVTFKDDMKSSMVSTNEKDDCCWNQYSSKRDSLLQSTALLKWDIDLIIRRTDFVIQRWGLLLDPSKKLELYLAFLIAYMIKFYAHSQSTINIELLRRGQNQKAIDQLLEILNKEDYPEQDADDASEQSESLQQHSEQHQQQQSHQQQEGQTQLMQQQQPNDIISYDMNNLQQQNDDINHNLNQYGGYHDEFINDYQRQYQDPIYDHGNGQNHLNHNNNQQMNHSILNNGGVNNMNHNQINDADDIFNQNEVQQIHNCNNINNYQHEEYIQNQSLFNVQLINSGAYKNIQELERQYGQVPFNDKGINLSSIFNNMQDNENAGYDGQQFSDYEDEEEEDRENNGYSNEKDK